MISTTYGTVTWCYGGAAKGASRRGPVNSLKQAPSRAPSFAENGPLLRPPCILCGAFLGAAVAKAALSFLERVSKPNSFFLGDFKWSK